jgi:predicted HTH domain antitoxin
MSFMNAIDTNLYVYTLDANEPVKQMKAVELLDQLALAPLETVILWQVARELAIPWCRVIIWTKGLRMSQITVQMQVSDAFRELGYSDEELRQEVPILLVLKRFRQGLISSGKAARILGWSRRDFLDLLSREGIPLFDPSEEELAQEWQTAQRFGVGP